MSELRVEQVIKRPHITEKNTELMEKGQYCFVVDTTANKYQIKNAVETLFGVKVKAVNTMNMKQRERSRSASRRGGRIVGHEAAWKKAIVTLADGERIDIFEQV